MEYISDYFSAKKISRIITNILLFIVFLIVADVILTIMVEGNVEDIISMFTMEIICVLLIITFLYLFLFFFADFGIIRGLIITSVMSIILLYAVDTCIPFFNIINYILENFLGLFVLVLISTVLSLIITSIIFVIIAIINKIKGKKIEYKLEEKKKRLGIRKIKYYISRIMKIINIIIITVSVIAFIISLIIFIKDGNYSIVINRIKQEGLTNSFTNQAYIFYFNQVIQVIVAILTLISYTATFVIPLDIISKKIKVLKKFAISVSTYYVIAPIILFCVTNIVAIVALIVVIIGLGFLLKGTDFTISTCFEGLQERTNLENFVRNMKYK